MKRETKFNITQAIAATIVLTIATMLALWIVPAEGATPKARATHAMLSTNPPIDVDAQTLETSYNYSMIVEYRGIEIPGTGIPPEVPPVHPGNFRGDLLHADSGGAAISFDLPPDLEDASIPQEIAAILKVSGGDTPTDPAELFATGSTALFANDGTTTVIINTGPPTEELRQFDLVWVTRRAN